MSVAASKLQQLASSKNAIKVLGKGGIDARTSSVNSAARVATLRCLVTEATVVK